MSHLSHHRIEPKLGDPQQPDAPPSPDAIELRADDRRRDVGRRSRPPAAARHHHGWVWPLVAICVVALAALVWLNQNQLRALLPRTELNQLLAQADQALHDGHLEGGTRSAHALYAKVLDESPDDGQAREGLRKVGLAELARASSAIAASDFGQARINLANARNLLGGGTQVAAVASKLEQATHPTAAVAGLITQAQAAMAGGKLTGDDGAAALYKQVLGADPDNQVAQHGLDRVGDVLAGKVQSALTAHDPGKAAAVLKQLEHWVPHDGQLPKLRSALAQARKNATSDIATHLAAGQADLQHGRFSTADGGGAEGEFQAVLALDPDNAKAQAGLRSVAAALIVQANAAMDAGGRAQAADLLKQAAGLDPGSDTLAVAKARLATLPDVAGSQTGSVQTAEAGAGTASASTSVTLSQPDASARSGAHVQALLAQAKAAAGAGHLLLPPGASAYDLYRQVLAINGNNTEALAGVNGLPAIAIAHFNTALKAANLKRANGYLMVLHNLSPDDPHLPRLTTTLATAWLDQAQADLDEDNHHAAKRALAAARKLTPHAQRLATLTQRLHND